MALKTCVFIPAVQADLIKEACPIKSVSYPALYHGCNSTGANCPIFLVGVPPFQVYVCFEKNLLNKPVDVIDI